VCHSDARGSIGIDPHVLDWALAILYPL